MDSFGKRLKFLRLSQGLKQTDLAKISGVSQSNISLYENGREKLFAGHLWRLARALGVSMEFLYAGVEHG